MKSFINTQRVEYKYLVKDRKYKKGCFNYLVKERKHKKECFNYLVKD